MENTMQAIQEKVDKIYGANPLASMEMIMDIADILQDTVSWRNENKSIEELLLYGVSEIEKRKGKDKIKTVVSHEKGYFIDELRDGTYEVSHYEKRLKYCPTLNEAVNYMIVKLN